MYVLYLRGRRTFLYSLQYLASRLQGAFTDIPKHQRQLVQALFPFQEGYPGKCTTSVQLLLYVKVLAAEGCQLREMGDAENLVALCKHP